MTPQGSARNGGSRDSAAGESSARTTRRSSSQGDKSTKPGRDLVATSGGQHPGRTLKTFLHHILYVENIKLFGGEKSLVMATGQSSYTPLPPENRVPLVPEALL